MVCCWLIEYGAYSSKAERLIVDQKVAGSSPARRPGLGLCLSSWLVGDTAFVISASRDSEK